MKKKSALSRIISLIIVVVFAVAGFNFGRVYLGDNARSRLKDVTNILVAGVDVDGYRTDLILMVQVNNIDKKISVLQIPRDTRVSNRRNDKKINSAYFSGIETMKSEVKSVTGLTADFFAIVTFDAFKEIVDALGGVTVDVPIDMNYHDPVQGLVIELEAGRQRLSGEEAMMFMRFRKNDDGTGYPMGDIDRNKAQSQFYSAVLDKITSPIGIIKAPFVYGAIMDNTLTDLNNAEVRELLFDVFRVGTSNINIYQLPGDSQYIGGISYFVADEDDTEELIEQNFR
ncbi:MAG TPA: LCP family protein [Candidatus Monoglobus merdigallinarum]|uniref:LCP family protein n=1 Tax=Candidatus Monoglobus merdigallinarum TaxID=2838698 RepID=A0A9D1PR04_9FIRM|nr:LCP family protein [Candidatus Monoglobus merdigallinarum]